MELALGPVKVFEGEDERATVRLGPTPNLAVIQEVRFSSGRFQEHSKYWTHRDRSSVSQEE